ncbi:daptide-type RiPP [Streptomyces sp. NPDC093707]|uniref:daptide-type RiPP n=1 Tax=Streptomyces sp. NPDC093707 TaxID=3154984 RepID=UPI00344F4780
MLNELDVCGDNTESGLSLRFEELETMDAPDFWTWYAGLKVGVVAGLGALAIT